MKPSCEGQVSPIVYACSGGSNAGQMTTEAAVQLDEMGIARMGCLAGLGGHISGLIDAAKSGAPLLVLDGCSVACAKKTVDHLELRDYAYVEVTALGIEKNHNIRQTPEHHIKTIVEAAQKVLSELPKTSGCCS